MFASQLKQLLEQGPVVGQRITDARLLCEDWFRAEPGLASFVLWSIFLKLADLNWDDQQGVSTAHQAVFDTILLPDILTMLGSPNLAIPAIAAPLVDQVVLAYHAFLASPPIP